MSKIFHISKRYLRGADINSSTNLISEIQSAKGNVKAFSNYSVCYYDTKRGIECRGNISSELLERGEPTSSDRIRGFKPLSDSGMFLCQFWFNHDSNSATPTYSDYFARYNELNTVNGSIVYLQYRFTNNGTSFIFRIYENGVQKYFFIKDIADFDNVWHHYSLLRIETEFYFFLDGILMANWTKVYTNENEHRFTLRGYESATYTGCFDLIECYTDEHVLITPTGYSVGERVFIPPNRYSGVFKPQKDVVNLDASKGIIYGTSPAVEAWMGNNSQIYFKQSTVAKQPTYDSTENAVKFVRASTQRMTANKGFDYAKPFTFSFWYKFSTYAATQHVFNQWDYPADTVNYMTLRYQLALNYFDLRIAFSGLSGTIRGQQQIGVSDSNWHHFLACFDGETLSEYIDGKAFFVETWASLGTAKATHLDMGWLQGGFNHFDGYLDDIEVVNSCPDILVGWTGSVLKYNVTANEQVFTPPARKTS